MDTILLKQLRASPVLKEVADTELRWLLAHAECHSLSAGDSFFRKGDPIDRLIVVLEGSLELKIEQNGSFRTLSILKAGDVSGALPFSRATTAYAQAIALENSHILSLHKKHFPDMIREQHQLVEALVHTMTSRVREFTRSQEQTEKMTALGKLSAGLAHELNNPAAAIARASANLQKLLLSSPDTLQQLASLCLSPEQARKADQLLNETLEQAAPVHLNMLARSEAEENLSRWLKAQNIPEPHILAERFVENGLQQDRLQALQEQLPDGFSAFLRWLYQRLQSRQLAHEIHTSALRISELVGAVKSYSHMDRNPERTEADLAEHLRNTLLMLNHKLKKKNVNMKLEIPENLPKACIRVGEINQVWTNLIDNAIDAVPEGGKIKISLQQQKEAIEITIEDNGAGIPPEALGQLFDPFFTTKGIGEGSGLGLDIAKRLVEGHGGRISVDSKPGCTRFRVLLPLR